MAQPISERDPVVGPPPAAPATPCPQPGPPGVPLPGMVREALTDLAARPTRDANTGQFTPGTQEAGHTLERSAAFWAVAERRSVAGDDGGDGPGR